MAGDRVTKVTLTANVAGYIAGMEKAAAKTKDLGSASEKLSAQKEGFSQLGTTLAAVGTVAAVGVAAAVKTFADFSAQMAQVQALAHATSAQMTQLSNAALTMGQGIGFSATQVADAETELIKAGVSVQNIMGGGLKGALDLAAAGQIDVGNATSIAAAALTEFGLRGSDVPHVADLLAAGADKALGGVTELGQALSQSGLVAHQFGLSVDDTVGTLAEFAQAGLLGSDAGTSLKQMFLQLASPSKQAQAAMSSVGFSAYDAQGKFIGITKLAGELHDKFGGMSDAARNSALSIIFGSDAIRAATILYKDGAKGNQQWINSVDDTGFAATQAAGKMNSLEGDLKKLEAAFQTGLIKSGSAANDSLRGITQTATGFVSTLTSAPQAVQDVVLGVTALAGAVALGGGAFLTIVPKVAAAKTAMAEFNLTAKSAAVTVGKGAGIAVALASLASGFAGLSSTATLTTDQLSALNAAAKLQNVDGLNKQFTVSASIFDAVGKSTNGVGDALNYLTDSSTTADRNVGKFFDGMTFGLTGVSDTTKRFQAQFAQLGTALADTAKQSLPSATTEFNKLVQASGGGNDAVRKLLSVMPEYKAELIDLASAQGKSVSGQDLLNLAQGKGELAADLAAAATAKQESDLAKLSGTATTAKGSITDLEDAIKNFGKSQFDVDSATRAVYDGIDTFTKSLKDNGKTLDVTTQKGRDNQAALENIASSYLDLSSATLASTGNTKNASDALQSGRDQFIKQAEAVGLSASAASQYADKLGLIPANVTTAIAATGVQTTSDAADQVKSKLQAIPKDAYTQLVADKAAAVKNIDDLNAKLKTVPASKRSTIQAEIAAAQKKIDEINAAIIRVPVAHTTTISVNTGAATAQVNALKSLIAGVAGSAPQVGPSSAAALAKPKKASGGPISGPGTSTSDSIPAMLSNGEYVVKASSVSKYGTGFLDQVNAGHYADGGLVHLATGGPLTKAQKAAAAAEKKRQAAAVKAAKALAKLNSEQFSFLSDVSRGNLTGTSAVDGLYQRASATTGVGQVAMLNTALQFDRSLTKLSKSSDAASTKLDDLKSSSASLASSVSATLGKTDLTGISSTASLSRNLSRNAGQVQEFAGLLVTLQKKGLSPALLTEVADLGSVQGLPLARSLSKANTADIKSINASYSSIQSFSAKAGQTVADANYKAQIAAADKNARSLEYQIAKQSLAIQRIIGHALKVPGYATGGAIYGPGTGTSDSIPARLSAGEFVMTASATSRHRPLLEALNSGYAAGGYVRPAYVRSAPAVQGISSDQLLAAIKSIPRGDASFVIQEAKDPVGTAVAVARRMNARSV